MRALVRDVEHVGWQEFLSSRFRWNQGEHVSMIGPTGGGKTTLALEILPRRQYVTVFATKPVDPVLNRLTRDGYVRIREWPPPPTANRVLLWPRFRGKSDLPNQRKVMSDALVEMFGTGGWTVYIDELAYLCQMLKLDTDLRLLWQQGRALKLTVVGATQRPAWVPLELYSQATHLFFWRMNDQRDLLRIGGIGSVDPATIRARVVNLPEHDVLHLNTRTGEMVTTRADRGGNN